MAVQVLAYSSLLLYLCSGGGLAPRHRARMETKLSLPPWGGAPSSQTAAPGHGHTHPSTEARLGAPGHHWSCSAGFLDSLTSDSASACSVIYKI